MCCGDSENAIHSAKNAAAAIAARRAHQGRTRAGTIASTASANGRPPPECGSSKRSQSTAITKAATPERTAVLTMQRLRDRRAFERRGEIVARADGDDGNSGAVQAQQQRFRAT